MKEFKQFTYAQTSPAYYLWMKKHFPALYEEIKEAIKRGQWIIVGGMWVEPDLNVPSGEALVRQRLYGQRFYLQEFGMMAEFSFLQDVFGFCWSLPQILKKSGAKLFCTGKIFWNKDNKFPIGMFHWLGPDGTTLPTFLTHFGYFLPMTYGKEYPNIYRLTKEKAIPGVSPIADYSTPIEKIRFFQSPELMLDTVFGYGLGDGGHGPIEAEMTLVKAFRLLYPKNFKFYRKGDIFRQFSKYYDRWPTWRDELYLEIHRGTYTTNSRAKRYNRELEVLLEVTEKASAFASFIGLDYPLEDLNESWKKVLFNQFHDILPGSSIPEVYIDAYKDYDEARMVATRVLDRAINHVFNCMLGLSGKSDANLCVFNALSWSYLGFLKLGKSDMESLGIKLDSAGKDSPYQLIEEHGDSSVLVPYMSKPLSIAAEKMEDLLNGNSNIFKGNDLLKAEDGKNKVILENNHLRVEIDKKTGYISSIFHKDKKFELMDGPGNKILLFEDGPQHENAWNIDPEYMKKPFNMDENCKSIKITENGPIRCCVEVIHVHEQSEFIQRIYLYKNDDMVRFSMDVDWHQTHTIFKLSFPTTIKAEKVVSEIPYAYIERPVKPKTKRDKARWEYACQKWLDLSDGKTGFGLVNNCKYGFNIVDGEIRLTVLRGPAFVGYAKETIFVDRDDPSLPKYVDHILHEDITYGIYIHDGTWSLGTWKKGLEFNYPVLARSIPENQRVPVKPSMVKAPFGITCLPENVIISALKVHEDEKELKSPSSYIMRLVEMRGDKSTVSVQFPSDLKLIAAREVDLLELDMDSPGEVTIEKSGLKCSIGPHEIKTILFQRG
ncbi:MAG: alpha-mannosidase, partial [Candidatus Hodarchaeota archaeon]